jgi:hypothetical protein
MKLKITENKFFDAQRIGIDVVVKMVKKHRESDPLKEKLNYAHFTVMEIIELFKDNGVLPKLICDQLSTADSREHMKKFGIKIYLGTHDETTYPPGKPTYKNRTTTILCNTVIEGNTIYRDLLQSEKNSISLPVFKKDPDPYLDQTNISPPDVPDGGPKTTRTRIYDVVDYPTQ